MAARFADYEIAALLQERKLLPGDYRKRLLLRNKRGHKEQELDIRGANGNLFRIVLRQNLINPLDFSIILGVYPSGSNMLSRLRRYNGKSQEHSNRIEGNTFYDSHTHTATERYQDLGMNEDAYAQPTDRYSDFHGALNCLIENCGFDVPGDEQLKFL